MIKYVMQILFPTEVDFYEHNLVLLSELNHLINSPPPCLCEQYMSVCVRVCDDDVWFQT